jgi:hypothetical protein
VAPLRTRARAWWGESAYKPLVVLVAVALGLRVLVMALYSTAVLNYYGGDSSRYLRLPFTHFHGIFGDYNIPAGYPAFLRALRALTRYMPFTIGVQHVLGAVAGVLLYLAARRAGASRLASLLPAVVLLYSGDQIFLEHAVLTEALWIPLLAGGLFLAMRALDQPTGSRARLWSLAACGAVFALAALARHIALWIPLLVAIWSLFAFGGPWRERLKSAAYVLVPAIAIVAAYAGLARAENGWAGFTDMSGFNLYGRVGQFADCARFKPPAGTAGLCESTPPGSRNGTYWYQFNAGSPLYRAGFTADPRSSKVLGRFARAAIAHEPVDYLRTVAKDEVRYFDPDFGSPRPDSGVGPNGMSFASTQPVQQTGLGMNDLAAQYDVFYSGVRAQPAGGWVRSILGGYQSVFRVGGLELLALWALAVFALVRGSGRIRAAASLVLLVAAYLFLAPPVINSYDVRYGVPPAELLAVASALGAGLLWRRRRAPPTA